MFDAKKYFLSDDFTIVDCVLAPILWRLDYFAISLSNDHKSIMEYSERVFLRDTFKESLSEDEEEMQL